MKVELSPLPYFPPQGLARAVAAQKTYAGPTVRKLSHAHANPRAWPSPPQGSPPYQKPASSNRAFGKWTSYNWKHFLNPTERDSWTTLALANPVTNYKGQTKHFTGFQLYKFFEYKWRTYWYTIGQPFKPITAYPDTMAYTPWNEPAMPSNLTTVELTDTHYLFTFDSTAGLNFPWAGATMARPRPGEWSPYKRPFLAINAQANELGPYIGHYIGGVFWTGILPTPPKPGEYQFRFWINRPSNPFTPSAYATFTLTIT